MFYLRYNLSSYPFFASVPPEEEIHFKCDGLHDGFYASIEHKCQVSIKSALIRNFQFFSNFLRIIVNRNGLYKIVYYSSSCIIIVFTVYDTTSCVPILPPLIKKLLFVTLYPMWTAKALKNIGIGKIFYLNSITINCFLFLKITGENDFI